MEKKGWKILAIVFIIVAVLEGVLLFWAWSFGTEMIEKEKECSYNICKDYEAYYFDSYENVCYCLNDGEIKHEEYLK